MASEFISKRLRTEFREFLVSWTLREIEIEFEGAGIACDRQFRPPETGERRSFVEQYYHSLDFAKAEDSHRLLDAYAGILKRALMRAEDDSVSSHVREHDRRASNLVDWLKGEGFEFRDGKLHPSPRLAQELAPKPEITDLTRRNVFDEFRVNSVAWSGRLTDVEFLERIYDLTALPSMDSRFKNAKGDIYQHRENNNDWPDDWIFSDPRFELVTSDERFLRFLCEVVHPVVRSDAAEAAAIRIVSPFDGQ